jgi:hypothetical protein
MNNMSKAKDLEIEILGERVAMPDVVEHLFWAKEQTDAFFEGLPPHELIFLSILDNWAYAGGKLTAYCPNGHWYSAKAHRMEEGCPFCETAKEAAETHLPEPVDLINRAKMQAETGHFTTDSLNADFETRVDQVTTHYVQDFEYTQAEIDEMESNGAEIDVLDRPSQLYVDSVDDFETLMQQLENAEGYDMVHGIHAFEFKDVPGLKSMNVLEAFLHVMENRILDDPHGGLQPPQLTPEYFTWARRREAKLKQPKLSSSFSQFENRKITDTSRIPLTRGNEGEDRMWAIKRNQQSKRW